MQSTVCKSQELLDKKDQEVKMLEEKLKGHLETISKQEKLMEEKNAVLSVKEEEILRIQGLQQHLDAFRYVLFHKVRFLEEDRSPLENAITNMQRDMKEMYSE